MGKHCVYQEADIVFICTPTENVETYTNKLKNHPNVFIRSTIPFTIVKDTNFAVYPEFLTERYADYDATHPKCSIVNGTPEQFNMLNKVSIFDKFHYTTPEYVNFVKTINKCIFYSESYFCKCIIQLVSRSWFRLQ